MTQLVANLQSPLVTVKDSKGNVIGTGTIIPPWNSFFQQFTQAAPAVSTVSQNPFTANTKGALIISGAATITLTRGSVSIDLSGQKIIPISIGDTVSWTGNATAQFLGA
jgi:hypothetical protein